MGKYKEILLKEEVDPEFGEAIYVEKYPCVDSFLDISSQGSIFHTRYIECFHLLLQYFYYLILVDKILYGDG